MSAKANISKLPEQCYHVLNTTGELIRLKAGESGYFQLDQSYPKEVCQDEQLSMNQLADLWNKENGVNKGQREAMSWGSMHGWGGKLANPDSWTENGYLVKSNTEEA